MNETTRESLARESDWQHAFGFYNKEPARIPEAGIFKCDDGPALRMEPVFSSHP
jgi:hypothetical protein